VRCGFTFPGPTIDHVIYEIRLRGHLGGTVLPAFADFQAETNGEDTLLKGAVQDQAALHGVLARIEALGLELLEVRRDPHHSPLENNR
jgi:epsilon-lactone hydrolase